VFDAAMKYQLADIPAIILAGKNYGTGSPRDWVAKGQAVLVCTMNCFYCVIIVLTIMLLFKDSAGCRYIIQFCALWFLGCEVTDYFVGI